MQMKGDEKLWQILSDKLEMLRVSDRLPEALRVAETAVELAQRAFPPDSPQLAVSFERLGQVRDNAAIVPAPRRLERAHAHLKSCSRMICGSLSFVAPARLPCDNLGQDEEAIRYYEKAIQAVIS